MIDYTKPMSDPDKLRAYTNPNHMRLCDYTELAAIARRYDELIAENTKLRAIVDKLPKTADGVPVVPGMALYPLHPLPGVEDDHGIATIGVYDPATMEHLVHGYGEFRTGACYSTREAAEAAKEMGE